MDILNDKVYYNDEGEYGKYVLNKLILPMPQGSPESIKNYERYAKRILWMDGNTTPGAFQLNASWYKKPNMYIIDEAVDKTVAFFKSIGMPTNLNELGVDTSEEALEALSQDATMKDTMKLSRIRPLDAAEVKKIYKKAVDRA